MLTDDEKAKRHEQKFKKKYPGIPYPGYKRSAETRKKISEARAKQIPPMSGKSHTDGTRQKQSQAHLGRPLTENAKRLIGDSRRGKPRTEETKAKQSLAMSGANNPNYGKHFPRETCILLSMAKQGITDRADYHGHAKEKEGRCWKWADSRLKIRKRVRAFFGNKCIDCGKTKAENNNAHLSVNHVGNNRQACCADNPNGWLFVPLCISCHAKSSGTGQKAADIRYTELINTEYGGKCYYSLEEYEQLVRDGKLKTEDYGRMDGR